jgi:hypothetical protein
MRWVGHEILVQWMTNAYSVVIGNMKGRYRCMWEDNINMHVKEIGCKNVEWIHLTQNWFQWWAHLKKIMNFSRVP